MEKKQYINPEIEIVKLKACNQLLAGSEVKGAHEEDPDEYGAHDDSFDW